MSIVMAVAALDTYMHRLIVERAYVHGSDELPGSLAKLEFPFDALLGWVDEAKVAARRRPHKSRPRVALKRQLRDRLLRETFQSYANVTKALGMAGLSGNWQTIGKRFDPPLQPDEIRDRLNSIVMRRNQIVHEGDYRRLDRPRDGGLNGISVSQASADINFLEELIDAIHAV
ncbi:MAG: hypothetical protein E6J20_19760 [Chloroflexi bacterium]|nr:MAG: hypothetical protein E6J20_19760 [Chloroflexota bacterium]